MGELKEKKKLKNFSHIYEMSHIHLYLYIS